VRVHDPKGKFKTQAHLCTAVKQDPVQIVRWFVLRWQAKVTYHEVREHLGVETQCQWADLAILQTTPALLGLFSLVTLCAHQHARRKMLPLRQTAWYHKPQPTFSDALALVRRQICHQEFYSMAESHAQNSKLAARMQNRLLSALCCAP
jgi:hypothetical protein